MDQVETHLNNFLSGTGWLHGANFAGGGGAGKLRTFLGLLDDSTTCRCLTLGKIDARHGLASRRRVRRMEWEEFCAAHTRHSVVFNVLLMATVWPREVLAAHAPSRQQRRKLGMYSRMDFRSSCADWVQTSFTKWCRPSCALSLRARHAPALPLPRQKPQHRRWLRRFQPAPHVGTKRHDLRSLADASLMVGSLCVTTLVQRGTAANCCPEPKILEAVLTKRVTLLTVALTYL